MGKIVCLMGRSSSGKDTIYKKLLEQNKVTLHSIVPYTTRPIRAGEKEGVEYHFTDEAGFQQLLGLGQQVVIFLDSHLIRSFPPVILSRTV